MKPLYSSRIALVLLALLGYGTAGKVEAAPVNHTDLQNQLNAIQSQLEQIPPAWSQDLPPIERFVLVLGGAAVLDKETGLVWEQAPDSESDPADTKAWGVAQFFCNESSVGGRKGWGLPTIQQLASLVDPTQLNPALPAGHPFTNVQSSLYWTATTVADSINLAWHVNLNNGDMFSDSKFNGHFVWCVRGGDGGPDAR